MIAVKRSRLAAAGVIVAAFSGASFRMVGPLYGNKVRLGVDQIAIFLSIFVLVGRAFKISGRLACGSIRTQMGFNLALTCHISVN